MMGLYFPNFLSFALCSYEFKGSLVPDYPPTWVLVLVMANGVVCEIEKHVTFKCEQTEQDNFCSIFQTQQMIQFSPNVLTPD